MRMSTLRKIVTQQRTTVPLVDVAVDEAGEAVVEAVAVMVRAMPLSRAASDSRPSPAVRLAMKSSMMTTTMMMMSWKTLRKSLTSATEPKKKQCRGAVIATAGLQNGAAIAVEDTTVIAKPDRREPTDLHVQMGLHAAKDLHVQMGLHAETDRHAPMDHHAETDHHEQIDPNAQTDRRGQTDPREQMGRRAVTDRHAKVVSHAKWKPQNGLRGVQLSVIGIPSEKAEQSRAKTAAHVCPVSHLSSRTYRPGKKPSAACRSRLPPRTTPAAPKAAAVAVVTVVDHLGDGRIAVSRKPGVFKKPGFSPPAGYVDSLGGLTPSARRGRGVRSDSNCLRSLPPCWGLTMLIQPIIPASQLSK